MGNPAARNGLAGLAFLLAVAALAMMPSFVVEEGPFTALPDDETLSFRVDINRADRHTVEALPGIGEVLADRIMNYRAAHGPFERPGDLKGVRGIGPGLVRSVTPYIKTGERGGSVGALDDVIGGSEQSGVDGR